MSSAIKGEATYTALKECRPRCWGPLRTMTAVDTYVGQTGHADGSAYPVLEGSGKVKSRTGYEYTGALRDGEPAGSGVQRWDDGRTVRGHFLHGTVAGSGALDWPNGDVYTGELCESVRHGRGTLVSDAGRSRYTGEWDQGMRHGRGTQEYPDGSVYEGGWQRNERHGAGCLRYSTGDTYEGAWCGDSASGYGVMGWIAGNGNYYRELYKGEWKAGCPEGSGVSVYIAIPRELIATATSSEALALPSQYAAPTEALLNVYVGAYQHGQRHGQGVFYYADGSCYEGGWAAGEKSGPGRFTTAVGEVEAKRWTAGEAGLEGGAAGQTLEQAPPSLVPSVSPQGLGSLLETEEELQVSLRLLLLRYNTTLKLLFRAYCHRSNDVALPTTRHDWWQHRLPGRMTLTQVLCLLHDARILSSRFSVGAALHVVAEVLRVEAVTWSAVVAATSLPATLVAVEEAEGSVNYRQFCETLIRVAATVNGGPALTTMQAKVGALLDGALSSVPAAAPVAVAATFLPRSLALRSDVERHQAALRRCYAELHCVEDGVRYGVPLRVCLAALARTLTKCMLSPAAVVSHLAWLKTAEKADEDAKGSTPAASLAQELLAAAVAKNRRVQQLDEDAETAQSFVEFVETVMTIVDLAKRHGVANTDEVLSELQYSLFAA